MKPSVLRIAAVSFALSLCASKLARAQQPCDPDVLGPDVCGQWEAAQQWTTQPYFQLTHMILLKTGDVLCIGQANPVEVAIYYSDPLFVNAGARDYRLQSTSPCRDAGNTALLPKDSADLDWDGVTTSTLGKDLAMKSRISGTAVDIGAYEWAAP